jgi:hypothetical protein
MSNKLGSKEVYKNTPGMTFANPIVRRQQMGIDLYWCEVCEKYNCGIDHLIENQKVNKKSD